MQYIDFNALECDSLSLHYEEYRGLQVERIDGGGDPENQFVVF